MKKTLDDIRSERYLNDPPRDPTIVLLKSILDRLDQIYKLLESIEKKEK